MGMLAGVTDCGRVGNGVTEEDWHWDLNPGGAAMQGFLGLHSFGGGWDRVALGFSLFATWLRQQEILCLEERGERTLAGGL